MAVTFSTLQNEVLRRGTRNNSSSEFTDAVKNAINFSLFRISREAPWRSMRRKSTITTVSSYTKGSASPGASVTSGSTLVTIPGATLITDGVQVGRKFKTQASGTYMFVNQINSETTLTVDRNLFASSSTGNTYEIFPQEEYVMPIQSSHRIFLWHEAFGYPFRMNYITDVDFYQHGVYLTVKYIPTHYRMWGEDMTQMKVRQPSILTISSSSTSDINIAVTVFGTVAGYPDYEVITTSSTNGTTTVSGSKVFSDIDRIVKTTSTLGRITVTANSAQDTISILPIGNTTSGIRYRKIQVYPLPNQVFPINVQYYKDPYALVNDNDVHELGEDFNEAIILLATAKIKAEANLQEADRFQAMFLDELRSLKRTNVDKFDWFPTLERPRQQSSDALASPNLLFRQAGANFGPSSRM